MFGLQISEVKKILQARRNGNEPELRPMFFEGIREVKRDVAAIKEQRNGKKQHETSSANSSRDN